MITTTACLQTIRTVRWMFIPCLLLIAQGSKADDTSPFVEFPAQHSVETETTSTSPSKALNFTIILKSYVDQQKSRLETIARGNTSISISREDQKVCYTLRPEQKTYWEEPLKEHPKSTKKKHWELLGSEIINEQDCDKYEVTTELEMPSESPSKKLLKTTSIQYVNKANKFLVREIQEQAGYGNTITTDFKNLKVGPPDASLFELPSDYKKIPKPTGKR